MSSVSGVGEIDVSPVEQGLFGPKQLFVPSMQGAYLQVDGALQNLVRQFRGMPEYLEAACGSIMVADLYHRGIYDSLDEITYGDRGPEQVSVVADEMQLMRRFVGDIDKPRIVFNALGISYMLAAILRPKGLALETEGAIPRGSLDHYGEPYSTEVFRQRVNFVTEVATASLSRQQARGLRVFEDKGARNYDWPRVVDYLNGQRKKKDRRNVQALHILASGMYASDLLDLLDRDPDEAEATRRRLLDRSFESLYESGVESFIGEINEAKISERARKHILSGDNRGGGHHIPSLNSEVVRVGGVEYEIDGGVPGSDQTIVAARATRTKRGVESTGIETFFPTNWTADEVIAAITKPERIIYRRLTPGSDDEIEEFVHGKGILMKRVVVRDPYSEEERIITAYPTALVPSDIRSSAMSFA